MVNLRRGVDDWLLSKDTDLRPAIPTPNTQD